MNSLSIREEDTQNVLTEISHLKLYNWRERRNRTRRRWRFKCWTQHVVSPEIRIIFSYYFKIRIKPSI